MVSLIIRDAGLIQILMPGCKRRPVHLPHRQRQVVSRHPERGLAIEATVSYAVECDATGEAQVLRAQFCVDCIRQLQDNLFSDDLY